MSEEDFIAQEIQAHPIPADEAWKLYKSLKIGALLPMEWNAITTDLARYFYIQGHISGVSYGRATPKREMLRRVFDAGFECCRWSDPNFDEFIDQFLQSEANNNKEK